MCSLWLAAVFNVQWWQHQWKFGAGIPCGEDLAFKKMGHERAVAAVELLTLLNMCSARLSVV